MRAYPGTGSRSGLHPRGRISPVGPMQPEPLVRGQCRSGRALGSAKKEALPWDPGGSTPAQRPWRHPRTRGPLSGDATSTRSSRGPNGSHGGDKTPRNPLRPSSSVWSLPPARPAPRIADAATFL